MKYLIGGLLGILIFFLGFWAGLFSKQNIFKDTVTSLFTHIEREPLPDFSAYYLDNLSKTKAEPGEIEIIERKQETDEFSTYLFRFTFKPDPKKDYSKSTTGVINLPKNSDRKSLVLMIRGYVDQQYYISGAGTRRSGEYFAENGYITIALDYLGYGDSDEESGNIFETRFQTYTTTLALISTLESISRDGSHITGIDVEPFESLFDFDTLFVWAHSNGGQIALTALSVTGSDYPTVLWAPVTKPFPYSVLYYTDQSDDGGKLIRHELSKLEQNHNVEYFSFTNYLDRINAPIQLYQGTNDDAIPLNWSQSFIFRLNESYNERELDANVELIIKNGADHNLVPLWDESVEETLIYYNSFLD